VTAAEVFCTYQGVDLESILVSNVLERIARMDDAVEQILVNDELKARFLDLVANVDRLFKAILPDTRAGEFAPKRRAFVVLADKIRALTRFEVDITGVYDEVAELLDTSIEARPHAAPRDGPILDLSRVDFEALQERFVEGRQRTAVAILRARLDAKLRHMVRLNRSRMSYREEFQQMIEEYNAGSRNVEGFFRDLVDFAQRLSEEEQRSIALGSVRRSWPCSTFSPVPAPV
jgi:type I restriction enzyme R subunit